MDIVVVAWDADTGWCVEARSRNGEMEAATGDVAECCWQRYSVAVRLAREVAGKRGAHVEVYGKNGKLNFKWQAADIVAASLVSN